MSILMPSDREIRDFFEKNPQASKAEVSTRIGVTQDALENILNDSRYNFVGEYEMGVPWYITYEPNETPYEYGEEDLDDY